MGGGGTQGRWNGPSLGGFLWLQVSLWDTQLLVTHPHAHQFLLLQKPQTWAHITIPEGVTQEAMHFHLRNSRIYSGRSLSSRAESGPWGP